jgi:hypothetical protein
MGTIVKEVMIKSFCIGGDSWACGEWQHDNLFPGGKQYDLQRLLLSANYVVGDISLPGEHNPYTIEKLKTHIELSPLTYDYILWFQSDPLRRPKFIEKINSADNFSLDYEWFVSNSNEFLDQDYAQLNSLGKPIYCIGGLSKLNVEMLNKYENLIPLLISFPEFLFPNLPHPTLCVGEWMLHLGKKVKLNSLDLIVQDHKSMSLWATNKCKQYFNLGDGHPNRDAYRLLFEYIVNNIHKF